MRAASRLALCVLISMSLSGFDAYAQPATQKPSVAGDAQAKATDADAEEDESKPIAPPQLRAKITGPNPAYLGQMVEVEVALLRDNSQEKKPAPFFPELRMSGAIALLASDAPPPELKTEDEIEYLVQKRTYRVFPQSEGDLIIPAIPVSLLDDDGKAIVIKSHELKLHADIPRGAGAELPLIARNVKLERTVQGDLSTLRVGESVHISLTLSAEDTDVLLLPRLELPEIEGLVRYPSEPETSSSSDRGAIKATRVESATYIVDRWGMFRFPEASVLWLDPETGEYGHAEVPALSFRGRVNPQLGTGCVGGPKAAATAGGSLAALALLALWLTRWIRRFKQGREELALVRHSEEERAAFSALRSAAHSGHDAEALFAFYHWLACAFPQTTTLEQFLHAQAAGTPELAPPLRALETRVATGSGRGHAQEILPGLVRLRKSRNREARQPALPALNP